MKTVLLTIGFFATLCINVQAQSPKVYIMDASRLAEVKKKAQKNDKASLQLIQGVQKEAEKFLTMKPLSVMDKGFTPVSGNKHDYMSQAPYFWYDSSKPNGLPYLRRDGQRNPEINKITDHSLLDDLEQATQNISPAYYLTGNEKYASKAATLLRYWFSDDATKMNTNLDYAEAIPGINN